MPPQLKLGRMRRLVLFAGAILLASILIARPQAQALGPDERYVVIYGLITEADSLNAKGTFEEAANKYKEAQSQLKILQAAYPGWREKVVAWRLSYITTQLEPLAAKIAALKPAAPGTNAPATGTNAGPIIPVLAENPTTDTLTALKARIDSLTSQNAALNEKLKEALSVQPAATDPRELAKAEIRIKELEKERDLLKVSLDQSKPKPGETAESQEQTILAEANKKLAQQKELILQLQKENETLKSQLTKIKVPAGTPTEVAEELQVTKMTLAILQQTNIALRADAIVKEKQLEELIKKQNTVPKSLYDSVEKERDALKEKVETLSRQVGRKGPATPEEGDLAKQLEAAKAKLASYEAKPVPYTAEELALLPKADLKVTVADGGSRKRTAPEFPVGTAPLVKQGEDALYSGKFEEAEKKFNDVLRQDPTNVYVLNQLASAQMEQNHLDEANQTLQKAQSIDPRDSATLYLTGRLCYFQEKYDQAFEALSLSAQLAPEDPRTQFYLGKVLIQKGRRGAAETALRKAVNLRPTWAQAHRELAFIYLTQEPAFVELAQFHYDKALSCGLPPDGQFEKILKEKKTPAPK